mgnify:CR=1 FL=1
MIFVDTSFLVSFAIDKDPNHARALAMGRIPSQHLQSTEDIMKETLTIISQRKGKQFCREFYQNISGYLTIIPITTVRYAAGLARFLDPKTPKDISLIDTITAVVCHELGIRRILSFDRHFGLLGLTVIPNKTARS